MPQDLDTVYSSISPVIVLKFLAHLINSDLVKKFAVSMVLEV
jgi:hypothetical protein